MACKLSEGEKHVLFESPEDTSRESFSKDESEVSRRGSVSVSSFRASLEESARIMIAVKVTHRGLLLNGIIYNIPNPNKLLGACVIFIL